jgi:hypothetical protein
MRCGRSRIQGFLSWILGSEEGNVPPGEVPPFRPPNSPGGLMSPEARLGRLGGEVFSNLERT